MVFWSKESLAKRVCSAIASVFLVCVAARLFIAVIRAECCVAREGDVEDDVKSFLTAVITLAVESFVGSVSAWTGGNDVGGGIFFLTILVDGGVTGFS